MSIELKGNNYYLRVFKRFNYKLQNNTFWVVIKWESEEKTYVEIKRTFEMKEIKHE